MRQLNGVYTQLFNKLHGRTGHLFQGRYKAILIQKDSHLLEVCRYVVLNPVRAKRAQTPEAWKWSSYPATGGTGRETAHPCLTRDWVLGQFIGKRGKAGKDYQKFVQGGIGKQTIWTDVRGQAILGEEECADKLPDHLRKHKDVPEIPRSKRYVDRYPGEHQEAKLQMCLSFPKILPINEVRMKPCLQRNLLIILA